MIKISPLNLIAAARIFMKVGKYDKASQLCYDAYNINKKLKLGEKKSSQAILMDEKDLFYHSLDIAITSNDINLFNFFYKELQKLIGEKDIQLELINKILNNELIDDEFISSSTNEISKENLDFFLNIISNYKDVNIQEKILNGINAKSIPSNFTVLNKLGFNFIDIKINLKRHARNSRNHIFQIQKNHPQFSI